MNTTTTTITNNNNQILILSLYCVARASLASANQGNPFISKSDAMRDINMVRVLVREQNYYSVLRV